jgi:hypothetical protein
MKDLNKFLLLGIFAFLVSCKEDDPASSVAKTISLPEIIEVSVLPAYIYGQGQTTINSDIPTNLATVVDSVYGFSDGWGGKTGKDTAYIKKSDIAGWPDTIASGGKSLTFNKYTLGNYKASVSTNVVIAAPISNFGPTALEGTYKRTSNSLLIEIKKVFDGVYVIDNPGGAGVDPFPYLLYNYKNQLNGDSLSLPVQSNPCGGGLRLAGSSAPLGLKAEEYDNYPPDITNTNPLTFAWKVLEFPEVSKSSRNPSAGICQWGTGVRTFVKQ